MCIYINIHIVKARSTTLWVRLDRAFIPKYGYNLSKQNGDSSVKLGGNQFQTKSGVGTSTLRMEAYHIIKDCHSEYSTSHSTESSGFP